MNKSKSILDMKRVVKALGYSFEGLKQCFRDEVAFRQEIIMAIVLIPAAIVIPFETAVKMILIASIMLILIAELANSAIEAVVDRISDEKHVLSKKAKDIGSAIVLISLINAGLLWLAALFHHFY